MSVVELNEQQMIERLQEQKTAFKESPCISRELRRVNLLKLEKVLRENQSEICEAIAKDFGHRSSTETALLEIFSSIDGIIDARKQLKKWMRPKQRHTSVWFWPAKIESCLSRWV